MAQPNRFFAGLLVGIVIAIPFWIAIALAIHWILH